MILDDPVTFRHKVGRVRYLLRDHPGTPELVVFAVTSDDMAIVAELDAGDLQALGLELIARLLAMKGAAYLFGSTQTDELSPSARSHRLLGGGTVPQREPTRSEP
jgi:hypothetical protein